MSNKSTISLCFLSSSRAELTANFLAAPAPAPRSQKHPAPDPPSPDYDCNKNDQNIKLLKNCNYSSQVGHSFKPLDSNVGLDIYIVWLCILAIRPSTGLNNKAIGQFEVVKIYENKKNGRCNFDLLATPLHNGAHKK